MSQVAVLGAGAWGTALAIQLALRGEAVRLWSFKPEQARELAERRENRQYLPGFKLPEGVLVTSELEHALRGAEAVTVVVPTPAVRSVLEQTRGMVALSAPYILASKGIETGSLMLLTEVVADVLGEPIAERAVALSGPSFAEEVARGLPTNLVAASRDADAALLAQRLFSSERLRVYTSGDPSGVLVGGALKNVIAIAAGASDGLGFGHNTRAALITRGLAEMARLSQAKGGDALTLAGLSGLGDLVLTATATLSRNRTVGFELAQGRGLPQVLSTLGHVAEGVTTAKSAHELAQRLGVELPITSEVYRALYEDTPVRLAVQGLLQRPAGRE